MTRQNTKQVHWTPAEIDTLKELYLAGKSIPEIAEAVGRSAEACRSRTQLLGLHRKAASSWTDKELAILREGYARGTRPHEIADALGRPVAGVFDKAHRLGLKMPNKRDWTAEEDEIIRRGYAAGRPLIDIARDLDRKYTTVAKRSSLVLGLSFKPGPSGHRAWTEADDEALLRGHAEGRTLAAIARDLDRDATVVGRHSKKLGLSFSKGGHRRPDHTAENGYDTRSRESETVAGDDSNCCQQQFDPSPETDSTRLECLRIAARLRSSADGIIELAAVFDGWAGTKNRVLRLGALAIAVERHKVIKNCLDAAERLAAWAGAVPAEPGAARSYLGRMRPGVAEGLEDLEAAVAKITGIAPQALRGGSILKKYIDPRHAFCWFAHRLLGAADTEIGRHLSGRDHTSVIYARRKIEERLTDPRIRTLLEKIADAMHMALPADMPTPEDAKPVASQPAPKPKEAPQPKPAAPQSTEALTRLETSALLAVAAGASGLAAVCGRTGFSHDVALAALCGLKAKGYVATGMGGYRALRVPDDWPVAPARKTAEAKADRAPRRKPAAPKPAAPKPAAQRPDSGRQRAADQPLGEAEERVLRTIIGQNATRVEVLGKITEMPRGPLVKVLDGLKRKEYVSLRDGVIRVDRLPSGKPVPRLDDTTQTVRIVDPIRPPDPAPPESRPAQSAAPATSRKVSHPLADRPAPPSPFASTAPCEEERSHEDKPAKRTCLSCGKKFNSHGFGNRMCNPCKGRAGSSDDSWLGGVA